MKTRVVNLYDGLWHVVQIDRGTIFGNPFIIGMGYTREESLRHFKKYFYKRLARDKRFKRAVNKLRGKVLGCWCKPKHCHGDIIVEYLEGKRK